MRSLFISQPGCQLSLDQEMAVVKQGDMVLQRVQIPLLEQILVFGTSQLSTQLIRACLRQEVPIAYLSRMGYCYGRVVPIQQGYRQLVRRQQQLQAEELLGAARQIVRAKLRNSRVLLMRQQRRKPLEAVAAAIQVLEYLAEQALGAGSLSQVMGLEGAGAASYFPALGGCISNPDFSLTDRSRRPPGNPVNAVLSFGYQVLWNCLLTLLEIQGIDPYYGCLHQGSERHPALASDLLEEFRPGIVDSLMLQLVNGRVLKVGEDFEYRQGGCFLGEGGRKKYLQAFVQRMEESVASSEDDREPRWHLLTQQIKAYKQFVYDPTLAYRPHLIR